MNMVRFKTVAALLVVALITTASHAVTIDWVTVGNPGNAADTTTYGAVATSYQIMKYEWTNAQYVEFLNAVDPEGTNPDSIYSIFMAIDKTGGINFTSGNANGAKYGAWLNMADKPVTWVSWFDAARVANWLHAGGLKYGTTASGSAAINVGAYTLSGSTSGAAPARNVGAQYWIPTENEWYKAAYYKGSGTNSGYWEYATQVTGSASIAVGATGVGTGTFGGVSPVTSGNFANYGREADWRGQDGNVTTVGTNGGPGAYGTFDMGGNVMEWNDLGGTASLSRGIRGGDWNNFAFTLSSFTRNAIDPSYEDYGDLGFRLASRASGPAGVPEIDAVGARLVAGLIVCGLALLERRRHGR